MNKLLNTLVMLFISIAIYPQQISREEADNLVYTLSKSKPDTGQINMLLKLAKYHILKPGEHENDLDSAATLINKAELLNTTIKSRRAEGHILLIKSFHLLNRQSATLKREAILSLGKYIIGGNLSLYCLINSNIYSTSNNHTPIFWRKV